MTRSDIAAKLKHLIESHEGIVIAGNDDALDIDSFTMMLVITYIKEEMGVQLDMERLDFDSFKSLHVLADLVLQQMAELRGNP